MSETGSPEMASEMSLCEVRIPTYRRPGMLACALGQLAAQSVVRGGARVHAIVFDDSPDREGEAVCAAEKRISVHYRPNPQNLGISRNLGQCFRTAAYEPATHVFCLEDDNSVFPTFIEENVRLLADTGTGIMLRDQVFETVDDRIDETRTTMPGLFQDGVHQPPALLTSLFTHVGLSNGALFWRSDAKSDLMIGADCPDPVLIEYLRPFAIREPVAYANTPLGAWRENGAESFRVIADEWQDRFHNYRSLKTISRLRRAALEVLTGGDVAALYAMTPPARHGAVDRALANALIAARPRATGPAAMARHWAKGAAVHALKSGTLGENSRAIVEAYVAEMKG